MIEEYHNEYYEDSDGEVQERGDDSDLSDSEEDLSLASKKTPNKRLELDGEVQTAPTATNDSTITNTTSSSPGGGDGGQALVPAQTARNGTPSPQRAQEAGVGSSFFGAS